MKEIRLAGSAGFCFGVSRSVDMAEKLIEEKGACASYGQLIHNEDVVARLAARGLRVVDQPMKLRSSSFRKLSSSFSFITCK